MKLTSPFRHQADFEHLAKVLLRRTQAGPVPIFEGVVDAEIAVKILGSSFPVNRVAEFANPGPKPTLEQLWFGFKLMRMAIAFYQGMGYDYVIMTPIILMPRTPMHLQKNPQQKDLVRAWQNEHQGLIRDRRDFEAFPWPSPKHINLLAIQYTSWSIPKSMKVIAFITGVFEDLRGLMGFENMAIKSLEEPNLLGDILAKLLAIEEAAVARCAALPAVGAIFYVEDLAFNHGTMLSPAWIREWLIPGYKRMADACHRCGKPFLFHSCGNINAIMEDLIETVGIDGRHSFQDNIEPVEEFYRKYHDRISVLGGVDVNLLARGTPDQVRVRTRQILEACAPGGGFIMGSGNSVTNFCKVENYLAMLEETQRWNEAHS